jgi:WD40 repeat protein
VHGRRVVAIACSKEYLLSVCEKGIVYQFSVEGMDLGGEPYCYGVLGD